MLACASHIDPSLKARYLDEKGADCFAIDEVGSMLMLFEKTKHF